MKQHLPWIFLFLAPFGGALHAQEAVDLDALRAEAAQLSAPVLEVKVKQSIAELEARAAKLDAQKAALAEAEGDAKAALQGELEAGREALLAHAKRTNVWVTALERAEADVTGYRIALYETTGDPSLASGAAALGILQQWIGRGRAWVVEEGPAVVVRLAAFLLVFLVFLLLAAVAGRLARRVLSTSRLRTPTLLKDFAVNLVRKLVIFLGLMIGLSQLGVDLAPVLAGLGILGFVVGFALQDTMGNFAAGVMLLLYRPFDVGDYVTAGGVSGTVKALSLVSTTMVTPDNQVQIVPNGSIWGGVITNVTANPTRRVDLAVGVGYDDDIDRAQEVLAELAAGHEKVLADPAPVVRLHKLSESSVDFVVRAWCKTSDYWEVYWDLTRGMKKSLDAAGLSIPFPQRDVHLHGTGGAGNGVGIGLPRDATRAS